MQVRVRTMGWAAPLCVALLVALACIPGRLCQMRGMLWTGDRAPSPQALPAAPFVTRWPLQAAPGGASCSQPANKAL